MEVKISHLNSEGIGVGFFNNKKVFIPKTCEGEIIQFKILEEKKDFILGELEKIIEISNGRENNIICPRYADCGGCNLLHLKDSAYYNFKKEIIYKTLKQAGYNKLDDNSIELIKIPLHSRRRVFFKVKNNKIGFFSKNTKNVIEIDQCPLIANKINAIIPDLKEIINFIYIKEIVVTSYSNGLGIDFVINKPLSNNDEKILKKLIENNLQIIAINYSLNKNNILFYQKMSCETNINGIAVKLLFNTFLQATSEGQNAIIEILLKETKFCKNILDLYCGIGTYTFALSKSNAFIHAIEGDLNMTQTLNENIKNNSLNYKITSEYRDLFQQPLLNDELKKYDCVILNPSRNGALPQCSILAKSKIKKIIMISCNPSTFARDANELRLGNYNLKFITGIDQFCKTEHLEIVGVFEKL